MEVNNQIQNPGSALGEAIGAYMETSINKYLEPLLQELSARLITKGPLNIKTQRFTKLLMYDEFGTQYSIDGVIVNESNQPLVLLESKYIRYKKHNRDKGSWICHAHGEIRRRYNSIRSSIAVLAGNWSKTSLLMMTSHHINVFLVPFEKISGILLKRGINFDWGEKERSLANTAWQKYISLSEEEKISIGDEMISDIKPRVLELISKTLSNEVQREIEKVIIEIHSNLGEVKIFAFKNRDDALDFLEDFNLQEILDHSNSFTIFDLPSIES
ncbi:hypothetical protein KBD45_06465 [Candidatus Dojkabacteria bacterium]|nr:hypothetical protein [Candidatus Dojkabacteria bacterium]